SDAVKARSISARPGHAAGSVASATRSASSRRPIITASTMGSVIGSRIRRGVWMIAIRTSRLSRAMDLMNLRHRMEAAVGAAQYLALTRGVGRITGFRLDSARVDGATVPFLVRGWGVPIVLVHGFGGDKESWLLMAQLLRRRATLIIPDLPGFGAASEIG